MDFNPTKSPHESGAPRSAARSPTIAAGPALVELPAGRSDGLSA
ncbi:MAG: hypothetical protein ACRDJX_05830 [Solirubrobacteraceae bacterium]